jgi:cholera toxin transcriptional activator
VCGDGRPSVLGPFELRTQTRELYKHGVKLKLRPQAYQLLALLLERAEDAVTREELLKRIWPSDTFVDFEHGLNTAIKELRGALSDSASEPRYIETLPKLGCRVISPVEAVAGAVAAVGAPRWRPCCRQVLAQGDRLASLA